jgi:DNA-directed RNA polymerase specialized sigma24 family protein
MTREPVGRTTLTCAACTHQLTRYHAGLLEEADAATVQEHLESCPNCRLLTEQIDTVTKFVGSGEPRGAPDRVSNLIDGFATSATDQPHDLASTVRSLYRLARSLDPDATEDLVQQTLLAALENGSGELALSVLAQDLTDRAFADSGPTVRSLDDYQTRAESRGASADPDGDNAELFYPDFYESGPDAGRHVDAPNRWGVRNVLSPDEDALTADLYRAVDDAIARMIDPLGQLVQLVDIDDVSVTDAAQMLRLDQNDAVDALHRARVHLRGVVDEFITVGA